MQKFLVPFRFEYDCTKLNALAEKTCRFYLPCTEKLYIQVTSTYSLLLRTAYGTDYLLHPFLNIFRELQQLLTTYYKYIQFRLAEGAGYFTHYNIRNIQEFSKDASDLRFLTSEFINRIDELTSDLEQLCNIIECPGSLLDTIQTINTEAITYNTLQNNFLQDLEGLEYYIGDPASYITLN